MYKALFVDTETTGLCDMRTPYNETTLFNAGWPYITQLSYTLIEYSDDLSSTKVLKSITTFVAPEYPSEKFDIEAQKLTGISYQSLQTSGVPCVEVINGFINALEESDFVVAHNGVFDMKMIKAECLRHGIDTHMRIKPWIDTMYHGTEYLRSIGASRKRYIKLSELYHILTGKVVDSAHSADSDVDTTIACFNSLVTHGVITSARIDARIKLNIEEFNKREQC